jgi:hypothetical protein
MTAKSVATTEKSVATTHKSCPTSHNSPQTSPKSHAPACDLSETIAHLRETNANSVQTSYSSGHLSQRTRRVAAVPDCNSRDASRLNRATHRLSQIPLSKVAMTYDQPWHGHS